MSGARAGPSAARRRGVWAWRALYLVLALGTGLLAWNWSVLESLERTSYDLRLAAAAPAARDPRIVVVAIDDESFKQVKRLDGYRERRRWPWPSSFHERAVGRLFDAGAAVVALDLLTFDTPSAPGYRHEDAALAALFARYPGRVVMAERYDVKDVGGLQREEWFLPVKELREVTGRGYLNVLRGPDGVVRRFRPRRTRMVMFQEHAFSVAIVEAYHARQGREVAAEVDGDRFRLGDASLRLDGEGRALIRPTLSSLPPVGAARRIPFWKLLTDQELEAPELEGAIVLVGPTTVDLHDRHATPLTTSRGVPVDGVDIQADLVDSLLAGSTLRQASAVMDRAAGLAAGILGLFLAVLGSALWGPLVLAVVGGLYWLAAGWLMASHGLWIEVARPLGVLAAVYLVVIAARLAGEERRRREIRRMFSAYVSPDVLSYLEENPEAFRLTGERREVTVFFSDVQGFTDMSETVSPDVLAKILNRYFTPMSELVMKQGGYVDKYIGDCVMAVFGVPQPLEDHAVRCCRSALEQLEALVELNVELDAEFGKALAIRAGLNSGLVSAGNMGSDARFEYTVMGDVVNLASRLEGANKGYGTSVMVGEGTHEQAREHFEFRFLDLLRVKGKQQPVEVYELLGEKGAVDEATLGWMRRFEEGWELHRQRRWDEAIVAFEQVLAGRGEDRPAALYLERCRAYREAPPPEDWAGVFVMTSK